MTRSTFRVLFYANGSKEKNGIVPIMGRVTINGTVAQFSCKRSISKELWDAKGNRAKGKSVEARETNLALDNIKAQIIKHYQRISDREAFVTAEMVRNAYQGIGGEYETLLKAFDRENEVFKKRVGKDRKLATYQSRVVARNYVAAFIKSFYKRSDMSMLELTPDFIKEFAVWQGFPSCAADGLPFPPRGCAGCLSVLGAHSPGNGASRLAAGCRCVGGGRSNGCCRLLPIR